MHPKGVSGFPVLAVLGRGNQSWVYFQSLSSQIAMCMRKSVMRRSTRQLLGRFGATAIVSGLTVLAISTGLRAESLPSTPPTASSPTALAQFRLPRVPIPVPPIGIPDAVPSLQQLLEGEPPLTTSLDDVALEMPILDGYEPATFDSLADLPWDPQQGYLAAPGAYRFVAESYCLKAGTHGPGGGNGYGYAELTGARGGMIQKILREAANYPDIAQRDIQVLLWGIISRTQLREMSAEAQAVAQQMLTQDERRQIDGGALGQIPPQAQRQLFANLPRPVRQVLQAEADLRRLLTQGNATYQQLEAVAVLTGAVDMGEGSRQIPQDRWSLHPDGYFVRYTPSGYSRTQVDTLVPEPTTLERDELGRIVALTSDDGYRVETDYNDQVGAITIPGEPDLRAYLFSQIRLISPDQPVISVDNQGWTFVGTVTGNAQLSQLTAQAATKAQSTEPGQKLADADRLNDLYRRYHQAKEAKESVDGIVEEINRMTNPPTREQAEEVVARDHYQSGLDAALSNDPRAGREWLKEHFKRAQRSWLYAVCTLRGIGSSGGCGNDPPLQPQDDLRRDPPRRRQPRTRPINPGGQGAVPGNTNRQRLGISARPVR